jgi:hypothetical protein
VGIYEWPRQLPHQRGRDISKTYLGEYAATSSDPEYSRVDYIEPVGGGDVRDCLSGTEETPHMPRHC